MYSEVNTSYDRRKRNLRSSVVLRRSSGFIEPCQPSKGIPATFQQSERYGCQKETAPVSGDWGRGGLIPLCWYQTI